MQCGRLALRLGLLALAACGPARGAEDHGVRASGRHPMVELGARPVTVQAEVDPASRAAIDSLAAGEAVPRRVVLEVHDVGDGLGEVYHVYLGLPAGARPDPETVHYVGTLSYYGEPGGRQTLQFDVTDVVTALAARGAWSSGRVPVTFAPSLVELPPGVQLPPQEAAPGTIGRVTLAVRPRR
jgi:hypothetical protein